MEQQQAILNILVQDPMQYNYKVLKAKVIIIRMF